MWMRKSAVLGALASFLGRRFHGQTIRMAGDQSLQYRPTSPFEALVIVDVAERTDQIQVHDRELTRSEAVGGGTFLQPVQAEIDAIELASQVATWSGSRPLIFI